MPHPIGLSLLLQLPVKLREALAVGGLMGVFVAEVQVEAEPLREVGSVGREHTSLVEKSLVTTGEIGRNRKHG
jgi:hypothetical protein